jgi:transmembrane sensor
VRAAARSTGHAMESRERVEEAAALWVARRHSEEWTEGDEAALATWLDAAPAHRVAYLRLALGWQKAGRLSAFGANVAEGVVPTPDQMQASPYFDRKRWTSPAAAAPLARQQPRRVWREWRAFAAGIGIAAVLGAVGVYLSSPGPEYRTAVGGLESVPMPDGSQITLNTNSEIRLLLTSTQRHVELQHGEAYFEVEKDPTRPFVVSAGDQRVVAVGTKFSVRRDADDLRVLVTEGKVRIEPVEKGPGRAAEVEAGSVAESAGNGVLVRAKSPAELEQSLSWRTGYLVFRATSLADAVAEFNRYNVRQLVIDDAYVAGLRIEGSFRATSVDVFVRLLETGFAVDTEERGERIILRRTAK